MASTPRPNRRLRLSVVGAAVVTALTTATAAAAVPPVQAPAPEATQADRNTASAAALGASGRTPVPRSRSVPVPMIPVFVLKKGRYTGFDAPGAAGTTLYDLNNAGTTVGNHTNPMTRPARNQPTPPMGRTV